MTPDDIRLALENAEGIPESALRAAVGDAAAVAPAVIAVVQRMARGCLPLPREERLLRFGLHALAAAREASACPAFLALLRRPPIELEWLFGEDRARVVARLLLGLFDGEDAAVCAVAADRDVDEDVRSGLLSAWARLVWEGRASRERLLELLDRFDQDELAPPQSLAWIGWQEAISLLGLTDWIERVQRGWETRMSPSVWRDVDRQDWIERTRAAHADPGDAERFDRLSIVAGDDPMADIDWSAEPPSEPDEPPTGDEVAWLEQLLWQKVPAGTMCLEEADGFLTALAAGPVRVPPAEFLPEIWRTPEGKRFDTPEHAALAGDLLTRLYVSIEATLAQAQPVEPWINQDVGELEGTLWANGFMQAVTSHATAWDALSRSRRLVEHTLMPILALIPEAVGEDAEQLLPERRLEVIDMLPDAVGTIHEFWQRGYDGMPRAEPVRVQKIGRNAPCPCGSGRKYKKCCGAAA